MADCRFWAGLVGVPFIVCMLELPGVRPALSAETLRVSYASVTGNTAVITYIARRAGLFEKHGLDVDIVLITGGPVAVGALLNGDVDLDLRAPIAALQAMAHGAKLVFLLSQSNALEYNVVTRPEIKTIDDLKGKRVGIIRYGGISELMVRYLFQKLGLSADKDISIVQAGQARLVAMEKGAFEATVLSTAETSLAKRLGFRVIDTPALPFFGSTVVTTPVVAAKRSDALTRFMKGYLEGIRFFLADKPRSVAYIADLLRTRDRETAEIAYDTNPQHRVGRRSYPDMAAVRATLDIMGAREPLVKKLKAEDLFDLTLLKSLDQNGFIDKLYAAQ